MSELELPFSYDPTIEKVEMDIWMRVSTVTLQLSPRRVVVVNRACPHCGDVINLYPVSCVLEDDVWKVKHGYCGGVIYEETVPSEMLKELQSLESTVRGERE